MSHTPGPWEIQTYTNYRGWSVYAPERYCIAERWYTTDRSEEYNTEMQANARLIAAAPVLLSALDEILALQDCNEVDDAKDIARAAVAKAKGAAL